MVDRRAFRWRLAWRATVACVLGLVLGRYVLYPSPEGMDKPAEVTAVPTAPGSERAATAPSGRVAELLQREYLFASGDAEALAAAYWAEDAQARPTGDWEQAGETLQAWARVDLDGMFGQLASRPPSSNAPPGGLLWLRTRGLPGSWPVTPLLAAGIPPELIFEGLGRFGSRLERVGSRSRLVAEVFGRDPAAGARFAEAHASEITEPGVSATTFHPRILPADHRLPEIAGAVESLQPSGVRGRMLEDLAGLSGAPRDWDPGAWWLGLDPVLALEALPGLSAIPDEVAAWEASRWEGLVKALEADPPRRQVETFIERLFPVWAEGNPENALPWLDSAPECGARLPAMGEAFGKLARDDPDRAKVVFATLVTLAGRAAAASAIAGTVAETSQPDARAWVFSLPVGYVRDEAGEVLEAAEPPPGIEIGGER